MLDIFQLEACEGKQLIDQDTLFENVLNQALDMTLEQRRELMKARSEKAFSRGTWIYCSLGGNSNGKPKVRVHFFEEYVDDFIEYEEFVFGKGRRFGEGKEAYFLYVFRYVEPKNIVYEGGFDEFLSRLSMSLTWRFLNSINDDDRENPYFIPWLYYYWREGGGLHERLFARKDTGHFGVHLNRFMGLRFDKHEIEDIFELPQTCLELIDEFFINSILEREVRLNVARIYESCKNILSTNPQRKKEGIELIIEAVNEEYPEEDIEKALVFIRDKMIDEDDIFEYCYYLSCRRKLPQFQRITVMPDDYTDDAAESVSQAYHCLVKDRDYYASKFRMFQNFYNGYECEDEKYQVKIPDSLNDLWNTGLSLNLGVHNAFEAICRGDLFVFFLLSKSSAAAVPSGLFAVRRNGIAWSAGKDNQPLSESERLFLSDYAVAHGLEMDDTHFMVNDLLKDRRWNAGDDESE